MSRALLASVCALALALGACRKGASSLQVTVDSAGVVSGVDHLHVTVVHGGKPAQPLDFPLAGAPVTIPPAQTLTLVFGSDISGPVDVTIAAQTHGGQSLATAAATASVTPGKLAQLTVTLPGAVVSDMAAPPDLVPPADLAPPPDLASPPDLAPVAPNYTVTAFASGLGGGVSSNGALSVEGTIGTPGPRVPASNGTMTVEPLIPWSGP